MKKLRKKSGFTLVECVVAMAILAIMTLMLAMMMQAIVGLRNNNRNTEQDIDNQANLVVNGNAPNKQDLPGEDGKIDFGGGIELSNGKKVYFDDPESMTGVQIGALEYDTDVSLSGGSNPSNPDNPSDPENKSYSDYKLRGALPTNGNISIIQQKQETFGDSGEYYNMVWRISFTPKSVAEDLSVKVQFPEKSRLISATNQGGTYKVHNLGRDTIRIEPTATSAVTVDVEFQILKEDYKYIVDETTKAKAEETVEHYFKGSGNGQAVQIPLNTY